MAAGLLRVVVPALPLTLRLVLRLVATIPGGYAFTAAWVAATAGVLSRLGLQRAEAVALAAMLGYLFFLVFLVWAFAQPRLARLWAVTAVGTALCLLTVVWMNLGR